MFDDFGLLNNSRNASAEINIAPLIDLVFILLIFFVVTTNFNRQTGIDVSKPRAHTAVTQGQKTLLIGISREGTLHIYGRQVSIDRLEALISAEISKDPSLNVLIISDQQASVGTAVQVMDKCALAGVAKVSIAAEKE